MQLQVRYQSCSVMFSHQIVIERWSANRHFQFSHILCENIENLPREHDIFSAFRYSSLKIVEYFVHWTRLSHIVPVVVVPFLSIAMQWHLQMNMPLKLFSFVLYCAVISHSRFSHDAISKSKQRTVFSNVKRIYVLRNRIKRSTNYMFVGACEKREKQRNDIDPLIKWCFDSILFDCQRIFCMFLQ